MLEDDDDPRVWKLALGILIVVVLMAVIGLLFMTRHSWAALGKRYGHLSLRKMMSHTMNDGAANTAQPDTQAQASVTSVEVAPSPGGKV